MINFSINPSRDVGLRQDAELKKNMIAKELAEEGVPSVPSEIIKNIPLRGVAPIQPTSGYEIIKEEPMKTEPTTDPLLDAARKTVDFEARKDKAGNVAVYQLPSGDGGGTYEVAGINDRYHPGEATRLAALPPEQRADAAALYIRKYTAPVVDAMPQQVKAFTQDMVFNRGPTGAVRYFQRGLNSLGQNLEVDGRLGPKTLAAIQAVQPRELMRAASLAQLEDERRMAERNPARKKFMTGLENRIRNRLSVFGST